MNRIFFIFSIFAFCHAAKLPNYFSKCSKSDAKLNECLKNSANAAWPTMVKGDKSSHIQQLSPFLVPFLGINVDNNLKGNLTDCTIFGLEETHFDNIELDLEKKTIDVKFTIPVLSFIGQYEVTGKLLFLPLEGQGPANLTFTAMTSDLHMEYDLKEKNGKQYIDIKKNGMTYTTKRGYFRLDNLFGGDERLGEAMNKVLDESWEAVNEEVGARVGDAIGAAYSEMLQSFFKRIPFDNFFAD